MRPPSGTKHSDRAFSVLTALGAFLGVSLLIPSRRLEYAPVVALAVAIPLGTFRIRGGQMEWLGIRHTLAVVAAISLGLVFSLLTAATFLWSYYNLPFIVFSALVGAFSGWFAVGSQRWAEKSRVEPRITESRWNPRSWGAAGLIGTSIACPAAVILVGISTRPVPGLGPTAFLVISVQIAAGILLLLGSIGLLLEASRPAPAWPPR